MITYTQKKKKTNKNKAQAQRYGPTKPRLNGPCTRKDNSSRAVGTNLVVVLNEEEEEEGGRQRGRAGMPGMMEFSS